MDTYSVEFHVQVEATSRQQAIDLAWQKLETLPNSVDDEISCTAVFGSDGEMIEEETPAEKAADAAFWAAVGVLRNFSNEYLKEIEADLNSPNLVASAAHHVQDERLR